MKKSSPISDEQKLFAEEQIKEQQKETKYDLRDFTISYIIQQFVADEFYIPKYQREFVWPMKHRVEFIESVLLGLPIPMMFFADMDDGRLEIVDGAQRIQTLESFCNGDLTLKNLKLLDALNGFKYSDLSQAQKRKFDSKALRIVVLEDSTTESRRQEIFHRINTSSFKARASEVRRGKYNSPYMKFIIECTKNEDFQKACPMSKSVKDRREAEELILRFFAYSNSYKEFQHDVGAFLDKHFEENEQSFDIDTARIEFNRTMKFVSTNFPFGFAKTKNAKSTPRVRFEAISVGTNLALREKPNLQVDDMSWLESEEFVKHTTTHASNSGPKLRGRIEYVKTQLLHS